MRSFLSHEYRITAFNSKQKNIVLTIVIAVLAGVTIWSLQYTKIKSTREETLLFSWSPLSDVLVTVTNVVRLNSPKTTSSSRSFSQLFVCLFGINSILSRNETFTSVENSVVNQIILISFLFITADYQVDNWCAWKSVEKMYKTQKY